MVLVSVGGFVVKIVVFLAYAAADVTRNFGRPRCVKRMSLMRSTGDRIVLRGRRTRVGAGASNFNCVPVPNDDLLSGKGAFLEMGNRSSPGGITGKGIRFIIEMGSRGRSPGAAVKIFRFRTGGGRHEFVLTRIKILSNLGTAASFGAMTCRIRGFNRDSFLIAVSSTTPKRCKIAAAGFKRVSAFSIGWRLGSRSCKDGVLVFIFRITVREF